MVARGNLGELLLLVGDHGRARAQLEASIALARESRSQYFESTALQHVAELESRGGEPAEAERVFGASLELARRIGQRIAVAEVLASFGAFLAGADRNDEAGPMLKEALSLARELDLPGTEIIAAARLSRLGEMEAAESVDTYAGKSSRLRAVDRVLARFLHWQLTGDRAHLEEAWSLLEGLRDSAPEGSREAMMTAVPLHRDIAAAWAEHGAAE
jgi:tetratricopeptide (TPR) repeat protein